MQSRQWATDKDKLASYLSFFQAQDDHTSYLIFPEGTDLSASNVDKSTAFARKTGRGERKFSLYPRTTGWAFIFPRARARLDAVYDITMFYVDYAAGERPSERALLTGRVPRRIHFYIERFAPDDLPQDEGALVQWMETRFERKEKLLAQFYEQDSRLPDGAQPLFEQDRSDHFCVLAVVWLVFLAQVGFWTWCYPWLVITYGVGIVGAYFVGEFVCGGIDNFVLKTF